MKERLKRFALSYTILIYFILSFYFLYNLIKVFFMTFISPFVKQRVFDRWVNKIDENLSDYGIK